VDCTAVADAGTLEAAPDGFRTFGGMNTTMPLRSSTSGGGRLLTAAAVATALAGAAALAGCAADLSASPNDAPTTVAEPAPSTTAPDDPAGTQPAGGATSDIAAESEAILAWQDRWYDNFCSSVVVSMADENCVGIAREGVELAQSAPDRIAGVAPEGALGDELRRAAADAATAAEAFLASGCDAAQDEECVGPTDGLTDAVRAYGDVVAEVVAAS
jgi:hypothetical protein